MTSSSCHFFQFKSESALGIYFLKHSSGWYIGEASPSWDISCSCVYVVRPSSVAGVNWSAQCSDSQSPTTPLPPPYPSAQRWVHHALLELMWKWSGATARPRADASVKSAAGEVCQAWVRLSPGGENNVRCGRCNLQRWWHCLKK